MFSLTSQEVVQMIRPVRAHRAIELHLCEMLRACWTHGPPRTHTQTAIDAGCRFRIDVFVWAMSIAPFSLRFYLWPLTSRMQIKIHTRFIPYNQILFIIQSANCHFMVALLCKIIHDHLAKIFEFVFLFFPFNSLYC